MTILFKAIFRFSAIPVKLSMAFIIEVEQKEFKICMETQKIPNSQSNMKKKYRAEGIRLPDSQLDYETTGIK